MPGKSTKRRSGPTVRKMPVRTRWVELGELPKQRLEVYTDVGEEPPDYEGWKINARMGLRMGLFNRTMRIIQEMEAAKDRIDEDDYEPTAEDGLLVTNAFGAMLDFCRGHIVDWNFVDEEGDEIPYSDEAWDDLDSDLVLTAFSTVQTAAKALPKGS